MTISWVIGCNGLLGAAICRELSANGLAVFTPENRFDWSDLQLLSLQLSSAVKAFANFGKGNDSWQIYWAAGVGNMGSTAEDLATETYALSIVLSLIEQETSLINTNGSIVLASSAGALYAGISKTVINENTAISPTTAYAFEKFKQEGILNRFVEKNIGVTGFVARISTLYGSGQAYGKRQGLIAEFARRILRNQPIQIYVPFDTIRDYINVSDAAKVICYNLFSIHAKSGFFTKIIASEQPTTIAEIISTFKKVSPRVPRIVTSANKLSNVYSRSIQFKSINHFNAGPINRTSLVIGIANVMTSERSAYISPRF